MTFRPRSDFLQVLIARGYLQDCNDLEGLDAALLKGAVPAYIGYDATAKSLHVGHLLNIMLLRWLQRTGHRPITLIGGGTTRIGDPSFRSDERPLLDAAAIASNSASMKRVFERYLDYGETGAAMLDNSAWLDALNYLDFLRDIGRHFSVNRMLAFESVRSRLDRDQSLSFLEFNYMILQAYDFLELNRRCGCRLQMGGSDQWGNILNGVDLARRVNGAELFGLTTPLLTTSDGRKMGKSAGGAIWLNADMLPPYDFWQFWRNTTDADVGRFLKLYTDLPLDECERLGALGGAETNIAKKALAQATTALLHGAEAAVACEAAAEGIFEHSGTGQLTGPAAIVSGVGSAVGPKVILIAASEMPHGGIPVVQLFVQSGLVGSGKEARRLIAEGGARLDDETLSDPGLHLDASALSNQRKLSAGRKRHAFIRLDG